MKDLNILNANANVLMANGLNAVLQKGDGINNIQTVRTEGQMFTSLKNGDFEIIVIDPGLF